MWSGFFKMFPLQISWIISTGLPSKFDKSTLWTGSNVVQHSSPRKHAQHITIEYPEFVEGDISPSPIQLQACTASPQKSPMKGKGSSLVVQIYMMDPDHVAARSAYNEVAHILGLHPPFARLNKVRLPKSNWLSSSYFKQEICDVSALIFLPDLGYVYLEEMRWRLDWEDKKSAVKTWKRVYRLDRLWCVALLVLFEDFLRGWSINISLYIFVLLKVCRITIL